MLNFLLLAAAGLVSGKIAEDCRPGVEVMQLQDVSLTFDDDMEAMKRLVGPMIYSIRKEYPIVRYGIASFSDKGLPTVGYGPSYGAWEKSGLYLDACYTLNQDLTEDVIQLTSAIARMTASGGADFKEAQLDALLNAALDPAIGWTEGNLTTNGRHTFAKLAMIVTDSFPHHPGYIQSQIDYYNQHYGLDTTVDQQVWSDNKGTYAEWVTLRQKKNDGQELSTPELAKLKFLDSRYMPYLKVDGMVTPFEYNADSYYGNNRTCVNHDYPDVNNPAFSKLLKQKGIFPVIMAVPYVDDTWAHSDLSPADSAWEKSVRESGQPRFCPGTPLDSMAFYAECTEEAYTKILKALNVPSLLQIVPHSYQPNQLVAMMESGIKMAVEALYCDAHTTTTTTTTIITSDTPTGVTTNYATLTPAVRPPVVLPANLTNTPKPPIVLPVNATMTATESTSITTTFEQSTSETPTGQSPVPIESSTTKRAPPPSPTPQTPATINTKTERAETTSTADESGPSSIVVGVAAVGAIAAGAAVAGVIYMKGIFGGATSPQILQVEDIEMPDNLASREMMEEVTMDMFT